MKPEKIEWVTTSEVMVLSGNFPDENRELLLSIRPDFYGDQRPKVTEGFFNRYRSGGFIDRNGDPIAGVYAWAYKPDCMLGKK